MIDSVPVFETRLAAVGVSPVYIAKLKSKKVDTLAKLAYISASQPGTGDESAFLEALRLTLDLGEISELPTGELSSLRRVWFEAHTVAVSEIRSQVERTEGSEPVRMPVPERELRLKELQARLQGVSITATLEPSHQLIDFCNQIRSDETLRYIDPTKCTSREQEIKGVKKDTFLKPAVDGTVKVVNQEERLVADMNGEFRIRMALQRRSLAMELVKLAHYNKFEAYHDYLFQLVLSEVPDSHDRISLAQIIRADKAIFVKMTEICRAGVSQRPDGSFPLEGALDRALLDPIVVACLQPLPKSKENGGKGMGQRNYDSSLSGPYSSDKGSYKGAKGKGKNKKGKQGKGFTVPKELEGLRTRTHRGENICFSANLHEGCSYARWGQRCTKGIHVCMKCGKHHAAINCTEAAKSGRQPSE